MDMSQLPPSHPPIGGMDSRGAANRHRVRLRRDQTDLDRSRRLAGRPARTISGGKICHRRRGGAQAAVNVSSLAGDGGGLLPNVNRWRKQLGLAPVTDADLANLPTLDASGGKATLIELSGTDARTGKPATLVGVVLPLGGQTWFYKLMGDATVVAQQKDALIQFVQSAKYPAANNLNLDHHRILIRKTITDYD